MTAVITAGMLLRRHRARMGWPLRARPGASTLAAEASPVLATVKQFVRIETLFIINEHAVLSNMARPAPAADLGLYRPALEKWMPKADVRPPAAPLERFDGLLALRVAGKVVRQASTTSIRPATPT